MKITDTPVVVFLAAVVAAFVAGVSTVVYVEGRIGREVAKQLEIMEKTDRLPRGGDADPNEVAQCIMVQPQLVDDLITAIREDGTFYPIVKEADFTRDNFSSRSGVLLEESAISVETSGRPVLAFVSNGSRQLGLEDSLAYLRFEILRISDDDGTTSTVFSSIFYDQGEWETLPAIALDRPPAGSFKYVVSVNGHPTIDGKHNIHGALVVVEL